MPVDDLEDWALLEVELEDDDGTYGEPYVLRRVDDEWWGVWATVAGKPEPHDPDPVRVRASWDERKGKLLTVPCDPGEHEWTEWRSTGRGNWTRHCPRCQISQGRLY
jgi:hypothetical protein